MVRFELETVDFLVYGLCVNRLIPFALLTALLLTSPTFSSASETTSDVSCQTKSGEFQVWIIHGKFSFSLKSESGAADKLIGDSSCEQQIVPKPNVIDFIFDCSDLGLGRTHIDWSSQTGFYTLQYFDYMGNALYKDIELSSCIESSR